MADGRYPYEGATKEQIAGWEGSEKWGKALEARMGPDYYLPSKEQVEAFISAFEAILPYMQALAMTLPPTRVEANAEWERKVAAEVAAMRAEGIDF